MRAGFGASITSSFRTARGAAASSCRLREPGSSMTIDPMRIGNVDVQGLARLAPMAGATNAPFRLVARECGSSLTTTEEMDAASILFETPHAVAATAYYP